MTVMASGCPCDRTSDVACGGLFPVDDSELVGEHVEVYVCS